MITNEHLPDEARFIREYLNLTGATESQARSVFMYACAEHDQLDRTDNGGIHLDEGEGYQTPLAPQEMPAFPPASRSVAVAGA